MPAGVRSLDDRYVGPGFDAARVHDAMRVGVVTCRPTTTLVDVSRIMVGYDIHSVVVTDHDDGRQPWGIVSALDVARATARGTLDTTAGDIATHEVLTVSADDSLHSAAELMATHGVSHLIAVQPETGSPVGVVSALGLTAVAASSPR